MIKKGGKINNFRIAFHIGSLPVYWYSLLFLLGGVLAFIFSFIQIKKKKLPVEPFEIFFIAMLVVGFTGARIWFILGNLNKFHSFLDLISFWRGGIAIEGSVFANTIFALFYFRKIARIYKIDCWIYFDIFMTNLFLAQAVARWGNFFNQEILGHFVSKNSLIFTFLPDFIVKHLFYPNDIANEMVARQPLFLYESFITYFCWVFCSITLLNSKKIRSGSCAFLWFVLYGIIRTIMEPMRADVDIMKIGTIPVSVLLSILYFFCGGVCFLLNQKIVYTKFWEVKVRNFYEIRKPQKI